MTATRLWFALLSVLLLGATCQPVETTESSAEAIPYERRPLPDPEADFDQWPSLTPQQLDLQPFFHDVEPAIAVGEDIRYVIELRNESDQDIPLEPCPTFFSSWGESSVAWFETGYLNCPEAPPAIPAEGSVFFGMVLDLPADLDGMGHFAGSLHWRLEGGNGSSEGARFDTIFPTPIIVVSEGGCLEPTRNWGLRDRCKKVSSDRSNCPTGIEGEGLEIEEPYPPRPYFEAFNLWRAPSRDRKGTCVIVVAGQQIREEADGEEPVYEPNGWLLIFGDFRHHEDGVGKIEVPLPRPVRIVGDSGRGYRNTLVLQSLADCSTIAYNVPRAKFHANEFSSGFPCPKDREDE